MDQSINDGETDFLGFFSLAAVNSVPKKCHCSLIQFSLQAGTIITHFTEKAN